MATTKSAAKPATKTPKTAAKKAAAKKPAAKKTAAKKTTATKTAKASKTATTAKTVDPAKSASAPAAQALKTKSSEAEPVESKVVAPEPVAKKDGPSQEEAKAAPKAEVKPASKSEALPEPEPVAKKPPKKKMVLIKPIVAPSRKEAPAPVVVPEEKATPKVETLDLLEPRKEIKRKAKDSGGVRELPVIQKDAPRMVALEKKKREEREKMKQAAAAAESEEETEVNPDEPRVEKSEDGKLIIHLKTSIVVKDLAPLMGLKPFELIKDLMELQIFASPTQVLELETVGKLCEKHDCILEREKKDTSKGHHKQEVKIEEPAAPEIVELQELQPRAPIVTFMGHVDHGKTSLLDAVRKTRVAAGESGGITQHIGAYSVERDNRRITFLDTPGHAAFTAMRARGANITDIVVVVVAADDGLMPQTLEAISHAQAAKVEIMVAINKVDLASANIDRVKSQLQEKGLTPEDWGGSTICCEVSATKGTGVDELLEMITLQSEILELSSDPDADARCGVIEAQLEQGRGPTATVIVSLGTLRVGDAFICGNYWGKAKQLINDLGKPVKEAGPATPVKVLGISGLPNAGDELVVMQSERDAKTLSEERLAEIRSSKLTTPRRATLENLFADIAEGQKSTMPIVLKGDVQGSLEALIGALGEIPDSKISLNIIHSAVGPVTESDVMLASASNAVIIGFSVKVENTAASVAKREGIQIKLFSIIYELIDQVREAMTGLLEPELRETVIGHADVKQVFNLTKGKVAGCLVSDGRILRTARARVLRDKQSVYDGGLATLRRFQDEVKEVRAGVECGIKLGDYSEYQVDDVIECYTLEKVAQVL